MSFTQSNFEITLHYGYKMGTNFDVILKFVKQNISPLFSIDEFY